MSGKKTKLIIIIAVLVIAFVAVKAILPSVQPQPTEDDDDKYTYFMPYSSSYSSSWHENESNVQQELPQENDTPEPLKGMRDKYTKIVGNGEDTVTIMVYMCGTDLESQGAMASYDLQEMAKADLGDNVNLLIYTGGCNKWHIDGISTKYNQILQIRDGSLYVLSDNAGSSTMVNPENLTSFIEFCLEHFEADRYDLIFWDHGGGTISGYGYDEKYPNAGSMTLDKIDQALTNAGVKFDFIGFDACLMATTENALMLAEHGDYMIASEESEPGIGWYYTEWLSALGKNTSMPTVQIGKTIADSFVSQCRKDTPRQSATLSVVDLAEAEFTIEDKLAAFAKDTTGLINDGQYRTISTARGSSREFGTSSGVDMVDLVDFINHIDSKAGKELKEALLSCIKYNNTSSDMSNSYGLSIYFPYRSPNYVNTVLKTYDNIEMDSNYSSLVKSYASYQTTGQLSSGGSHSPYQSFDSYDSNYYYLNQGSSDAIYDLLNSFLGGYYQDPEPETEYYDYQSGYADYYGDDWGWLFENGGWEDSWRKSLSEYVSGNHFDADLSWKNGKINLTKDQWKLVSDLKLNMFVDDGKGYIDLGKDCIYDIDKKGNLLKQEDLTWLAASVDNENWQVVPFYYESSLTDGDITVYTGRIPVLYNGQLADLIIKLDDNGVEVIGVSFDYDNTAVAAKSLNGLEKDDVLEFVCDYYDYDGNFQAAYKLGNKIVIGEDGKLFLGDVDISSYKTLVNYEFVDIYQQSYWTDAMK